MDHQGGDFFRVWWSLLLQVVVYSRILFARMEDFRTRKTFGIDLSSPSQMPGHSQRRPQGPSDTSRSGRSHRQGQSPDPLSRSGCFRVFCRCFNHRSLRSGASPPTFVAIFIPAVLGIFLGLTKVIGNLLRSVFFMLKGDLPTKTAEEMVLTREYHYFEKQNTKRKTFGLWRRL